MPRALILGPQRRSIVSSMPMTNGPCGTKVAIRSVNRHRATARLDQRFRLSTRWKLAKLPVSRCPMMLNAAVTVRRPGVRSAPATNTRTWRQVGRVNSTAKGAIQRLRLSEAGDVTGLRWLEPLGKPGWNGRITMGMGAMLERIEGFNFARGGGVIVRKVARGYTLLSERTGAPIARFRPIGDGDKVKVLWWNGESWAASGPFGIANEPDFWIHA